MRGSTRKGVGASGLVASPVPDTERSQRKRNGPRSGPRSPGRPPGKVLRRPRRRGRTGPKPLQFLPSPRPHRYQHPPAHGVVVRCRGGRAGPLPAVSACTAPGRRARSRRSAAMPPAWPRDTARNDDAHPSAAQERLNGGGAPSQFIVVSSGPARWPAAPSARTCPALPAGSTRRAGPSPPPRCGCDVSTGSFPLPPPGPGWEPFPPLHSPLFPPFARRTPAACDPLSPGPHTQTPFTPSSHISLHTGTGPFPVPPQPSPDAPLLQGPHQLVAPPSRIPFLLTWTASNPCLPLSLPAKPLSSFLPLLPHSRTP